CQKYSTSPYTF
nr:immunoglobulin light chain junction region [Macaca mulatta]MPN91004.1 immunoglobulin light chain junction region [Macaca mulatta]MPN91008.1 immunoglobulin light chain junction region [Macaca mulatta]MPN91315.1 immunoglobulin light chain junction region [Macaca mulatta]MPN91823.1 immunoglobulin light chain junction region [Macaca mulatta]